MICDWIVLGILRYFIQVGILKACRLYILLVIIIFDFIRDVMIKNTKYLQISEILGFHNFWNILYLEIF